MSMIDEKNDTLNQHSDIANPDTPQRSETEMNLSSQDSGFGYSNDHAVQASQSSTASGINTIEAMQGVGYLLRRARVAKGLSVDDVSRQLRLSVERIEAIEQEEFKAIPGRTFLRGFIRNYANLVQLDPVPLLKMLPESARAASGLGNVPLQNKLISFSVDRKKPKNHSLPIVITMSILIVGAYFFLGNRHQQVDQPVDVVSGGEVKPEIGMTTSATTTKEIQLSPLVVQNAVNPSLQKPAKVDNVGTTSVEIKLDLQPTTVASVSKPVIAAVEGAEQPTDTEMRNLQFTFSADSWIKVVDGTGKNLLEQVKKAGSEQAITGKRPFTITLGNASGVNLTYNDKEIDVSSYKKQGGTARFVLE